MSSLELFEDFNKPQMQIYIETERMRLRAMEATDLQGIYELDSDPEVHRFLGKKPIKNLKDAEGIINYIRKQYKIDGIGRWAVVDRKTNEFVGWAGLKYEREVRKEMDYYDLGYRLKKKFWGKGIATEIAMASLKYGFQKMNLKEIFAGAHVDNIASNKVLQKVGLSYLETFEYDGDPHHWYRITRSEWLKYSS